MPDKRQPLIEAKALTLGYDGDDVILRDLSFTVNEGDYLCIVGENGSGKSTLIKTLLGLIPPLKGSVAFGKGLRHSDIGYLPQQTLVQRDFPASVSEIVLSGCQGLLGWHPFYTREQKAKARTNMERLGISALSSKCYRELSGGQQQRVLLARALCSAEKILLMDEPVAGLDPLVTADLYHLIWRLHEEGVTILMVSHDIEAALKYASHVLHIGQTLFWGTRDAYAASPLGQLFMNEKGGAVTHGAH